MAKVQLKNYDSITPQKHDLGISELSSGINKLASGIGSAVDNYSDRKRKEELAKAKEVQAQAEQMQKQSKAIYKMQDAQDELAAQKNLVPLQTEYLRQANEVDKKYAGNPTSKEAEIEKNELANNILNAATSDNNSLNSGTATYLSEKFKSWQGAKILSDAQKAINKDFKNWEENLIQVTNDSIDLGMWSGAESGETGEWRVPMALNAQTKETLNKQADAMGMTADKKEKAIKEYDEKFLTAVISGMAKTNPEQAEELLKQPDIMAEIVNSNNVDGQFDALSVGLDEKIKPVIEKAKLEIAAVEQEKVWDKEINESIDYLTNPEKVMLESNARGKEIQQIFGTKAFVPPTKEVIEKRMYGQVDNSTRRKAVSLLEDVVRSPNGSPVDGLLKAFELKTYLSEAGASERQMEIFNNASRKMLVDRKFKESVQTLFSGESFFNSPSVNTKFEENNIVNNIGNEAYFGAMDALSQGDSEAASRIWTEKSREAYEYLYKDKVNIPQVLTDLANGKQPMQVINGKMTQIIGRTPSGDFIIKNTERVVK